jgi:hypothetical protein
MLPEEVLEKRVILQTGSSEAKLTATEYWLEGELVHRSLNIELIGRDLGAVQEYLGA